MIERRNFEISMKPLALSITQLTSKYCPSTKGEPLNGGDFSGLWQSIYPSRVLKTWCCSGTVYSRTSINVHHITNLCYSNFSRVVTWISIRPVASFLFTKTLSLGWLSVENRRLYFLGIMAYRVRNLTVPAYISDLFCEPSSDLRQSTRHSGPQLAFHIPLHRATTYRSSFRLSAAYFWNSLPQETVSAQNLGRFKGLLFEFLRSSEL